MQVIVWSPDGSGFASEPFADVEERAGDAGVDTHAVTSQPVCARADLRAEVLADAPSGYWRLGDAVGSSVAADSSGDSNAVSVVDGAVVFGAPGLVAAGHLDGTLDEVAFYSGRALLAERVAAHYCAGLRRYTRPLIRDPTASGLPEAGLTSRACCTSPCSSRRDSR
ncbi:MAG: hypothetical protein U1F43_01445 [Myxococcota bacterium]